MDTKMYRNILFFIVIAISNTGCPDKCINPEYHFEVEASIKPDNEAIKIGDTIFVESHFSESLLDVETNMIIEYSNAKKIGSNIGFTNLDFYGNLNYNSILDFSYVSISGQIYNSKDIPLPNQVNQLTYEYANNEYKLKIGIIPRKKGIYLLGLGNGLSLGRKNTKECDQASFSITLSNTDQHLYLFEDVYGNLSEYDRQRSYCFRVVD
ncbi:MAG: hypothetical protein NW226_26570 [Microscillaceae bacterium]|nr:hypothetical protein [Microscillaceae bacterium]